MAVLRILEQFSLFFMNLTFRDRSIAEGETSC